MPQKLLGIIGYPLSHSVSPVFQQMALDHYSLEIRYEVWETQPKELGERIRWMKETPGLLGANVTIPYKEKVVSLLDELVEDAPLLGAVNTILVREGRLIGYNTDLPGFLRALREDGNFCPRAKSVLVLGAGGLARAVVAALAQAGASSITIANRTLGRAQILARVVKGIVQHVEAIALNRNAVNGAKWANAWDLVVNCTSVGMKHGPAEEKSPLAADLIPREALVCDLVYNPSETSLLLEAKKAGARSLGGLHMLVYQGAESFRRWTGLEPPIDVMFRAARVAMDDQV